MALFGNERDGAPPRPGNAPGSTQINMVGEGTVFEGTLKTDTDVRISGRIVGTLEVGGRVVVAAEGSVDGEVKASHADIAGQVDGQLDVSERLILRSTARIEGTVRTGRLIVEEGARFNGECQMGQAGLLHQQPSAAKPSATKTPAAKTPAAKAAAPQRTPPLPDSPTASDKSKQAAGEPVSPKF